MSSSKMAMVSAPLSLHSPPFTSANPLPEKLSLQLPSTLAVDQIQTYRCRLVHLFTWNDEGHALCGAFWRDGLPNVIFTVVIYLQDFKVLMCVGIGPAQVAPKQTWDNSLAQFKTPHGPPLILSQPPKLTPTMPLSSVNLSSPLSLYSIPVVWFTAFYPNMMKFTAIDKTIGYNNVQPRSNTAKLRENKNVTPKLAAKIERMEGAHMNGLEAFPLWTAAILAANVAGLDHGLLNKVSLAYITARIVYNRVYIHQESMGTSYFRTAIFFLSLSMPMTLLIKAANKVASTH